VGCPQNVSNDGVSIRAVRLEQSMTLQTSVDDWREEREADYSRLPPRDFVGIGESLIGNSGVTRCINAGTPDLLEIQFQLLLDLVGCHASETV